jgi:hypothetical protein
MYPKKRSVDHSAYHRVHGARKWRWTVHWAPAELLAVYVEQGWKHFEEEPAPKDGVAVKL